MLSFTSRDGLRRFTLDQLAAAIGQSRDEANRRLATLSQTTWRGQPLLSLELDLSGEVTGATLAPIERLAISPPATVTDPLPSRPSLPAGLVADLMAVGLNQAQIDRLAGYCSEGEIRRQLAWLPARGARNPAALLIRAVEQHWDEPKEGA